MLTHPAAYLDYIAATKNLAPPVPPSSSQNLSLLDNEFAFLATDDSVPDLVICNQTDDDLESLTDQTPNELEPSAPQFLVSTVKENHKLYTKRETHDAKLAHILYHGMGRPNLEALKALICGGYIRNCSVTAGDID